MAGYYKNYANQSSAVSISRVSASATSVNLVAANTDRKGVLLFNDSTSACRVKYGTTASTTSFTVYMVPKAHHFIDGPVYIGAIDAIWESANGAMQVTEL